MLAVGNDDQWRRFCRIADIPENESFATNRDRVARHDELKPLLDAAIARRTRGEWIERLLAAGVPCGSVRDLKELFADPQLAAREMTVSVEHAAVGPLSVLGLPIKLSSTPGAVRSAPPTLGQHTEAVLKNDFGMSQHDVDRLRAAKAI